MRDATFAYSSRNNNKKDGGGGVRLLNCTLSVGPGEVVAVVGSLGSGKSSLIRALLGEMTLVGEGAEGSEGVMEQNHQQQQEGGQQQQQQHQPPQPPPPPQSVVPKGGEARVGGSVAYVPQTPWVPNESFRCVFLGFGWLVWNGRVLCMWIGMVYRRYVPLFIPAQQTHRH